MHLFKKNKSSNTPVIQKEPVKDGYTWEHLIRGINLTIQPDIRPIFSNGDTLLKNYIWGVFINFAYNGRDIDQTNIVFPDQVLLKYPDLKISIFKDGNDIDIYNGRVKHVKIKLSA